MGLVAFGDMPGRLLALTALTVTCALMSGCSQNESHPSGSSQPASSNRSIIASTSATPSTSPIPPNAARYETALDAGIAGVEAKTGLTYSGNICSSAQPCLGLAQLFGNPGAGGLDAAYVQIPYAASGYTNCFAYVFFDAGWHYLRPVVCPKQAGYNPVLGASDHVAVPGSCANVRLDPGLSSKVLTCIRDGTIVSIDPDFPRYVDRHIWWSINGHEGWMAHDFLITDTTA